MIFLWSPWEKVIFCRDHICSCKIVKQISVTHHALVCLPGYIMSPFFTVILWRLCFHIPFWNQLTNWSYVSWPRDSWPSYSPSFYVHLLVAICFNFVPKFQHFCSSMSPRSVTLGWRSNTFGKCLMKGDLRSASKWQLCKTSCPGTTEITSCTNERRVTRAPRPCHVVFRFQRFAQETRRWQPKYVCVCVLYIYIRILYISFIYYLQTY